MESQRTIWTAIIVLIVGIALIFLRSTAIDIVVMVLGAMFVAASALNLFFLFRTPGALSKSSVESEIHI